MAKNADGPKSGRMGFGYREHQEAGIPLPRERPAAELNAELEERYIDRANRDDQLRLLLQDHPHLKARAEELLKLRWKPDDLLHQLWQEAREYRRKREAVEKVRKRSAAF